MTDEEKKQLVEAVITQLKNEGTDVSNATIVENVGGVSYVLCYDTNGNVIRVTPDTLNQHEEELNAKIEENTTNIQHLFEEAVKFDTLEVEESGDGLGINYGTFDGHSGSIEIPFATEEKAGVMSAKDKNIIDTAPTELLKRIQGTSDESSASNDPFKRHPTNFSSGGNAELIEALDSMHSTDSTRGIDGFWRLYIGKLAVEVNNVAIKYTDDTWVQTIKLPYKWYKSSNQFGVDSDGNYHIHTYYRIHKDGAWGEWIEVEEELKSAITAEENRAKAAEVAIRKLITDLVGESPETLDTIHEISSWILNDQTGAAAMATKINENSEAIRLNYEDIKSLDTNKAERSEAMYYDTLGVSTYKDKAEIYGKSISGKPRTCDFPAATREKAGVMTAEDKGGLEKLITIDYADNSYTAGKWVEENGRIVAASSSSYAKYSPIPVCGGQKIVYSAASGSDNIPLYITDKDGVVIYSTSRMNGEIYAPSEAAFIYITSTIAGYSCVVYGVYDTYSYRAQKLDKLIGEDIALPLNGYYTATGAWQASDSWYCTDKIAVSENSDINTNVTYIACWDINGKWIGRTEAKNGILEGTNYIALMAGGKERYLRFNNDYCNIPTQEDIHNISRRIDSLTGEIKGRVGIDVDTSNVIDLTNNNVTVIESVAGEAGARYSVPITIKGGYGITMKFKMPDDLHTAVYERELISFGTRNHNTTNGFSVDIKSVLPTNDLSQVLCKSSLGFYPTNSKTNNYAGRVDVQGRTEREFVGDVAFSLRYTGSLEGNEDIAYTLGENALRIYHTTTDVDVLNVPYPEDNFITSLLDAVNAHSGIVEAVGYCAENLSLDNIIKCSAIPLVGTYEGTTDAFPSFVLLKDDSWHTLEVRFDASKGKGVDMIAGYIDGRRFYHVSDGYKLYGDGYFKSELIFGCDGVAVKSIKVAPTLKSEIPNIVALCQHSINGDEKFNSTVTSGTNLSVTYGRTEELLRVFKKYGFKYVTSEQINGYLRRGEVLPHNSFTIIHDDYHYMRENAEKEYARDIRKLYLRNGIKASFGLIPAYLTDEEIAEVEKDKDVFEFLIHDDYSLSSSKGYQAIADRIANNISNFKSKLYTSNIWVYTGGVFDANTKMMLQASGISIAYYTSGTTTSGGICDASDRMGLPRLYCNDTGTTISELEEILSNLVNH